MYFTNCIYLYILSAFGTFHRYIFLNANRITVTENTLIQRSDIQLYKQTNYSYRQSTTRDDKLITRNYDLT